MPRAPIGNVKSLQSLVKFGWLLLSSGSILLCLCCSCAPDANPLAIATAFVMRCAWLTGSKPASRSCPRPCVPSAFCLPLHFRHLTVVQWDDFLVGVLHSAAAVPGPQATASGIIYCCSAADERFLRCLAPWCASVLVIDILRSSRAQLHMTRVPPPANLPQHVDYLQALESACSSDAEFSQRAFMLSVDCRAPPASLQRTTRPTASSLLLCC
jgi:hypothetical protein